MAIIVNGTTIPTNGDYIKVGSTLVDKVDVVNNSVRTTVWEKQKICGSTSFTKHTGGGEYHCYNCGVHGKTMDIFDYYHGTNCGGTPRWDPEETYYTCNVCGKKYDSRPTQCTNPK